MSADDLQQVEQAIRTMLAKGSTPISAPALIAELAKSNIDEEATRIAMWTLIDRSQITLTSDRKLTLSHPS